MLCRNPFIRDPSGKCFHSTNKEDWLRGIPFPCGQCLPCRINKRRVWSTRLWLEAMSHSDNLPMLTLTYDDEHLPLTNGIPSLCKDDVQKYVKHLRNLGYKFRYYIAGEYGENTHRPHYHALFFGVSQLFINDFVQFWNNGLVHVGYDTSFESIQYVAGYVTKKFVKKSDDLQPEFALMSRKPALGSLSLKVILDVYKDHPELVEKTINNFSLKLNGRYSPIGRTLVDKLRVMLDIDCTNDSFVYELRKLALDTARTYNVHSDTGNSGPLVQALLAESKVRNQQIVSHNKIWNRRLKV